MPEPIPAPSATIAELIRRRAAFLALASKHLAATLDYEATLQQVASLAVPDLADGCAIHVLDPDGAIRQVAVAHVDPAMVEAARDVQRRYPPEPQDWWGVARVLH
ncbi:MAG: hypothetical protein ACRDI2_21615, partial [Chloroflexota bacterium]